MGLTLSDVNRSTYMKYRSDGMTHEEAIDCFPEHVRERIEADSKLSAFESHYGMTFKKFMIINLVLVVLIFLVVFLKMYVL